MKLWILLCVILAGCTTAPKETGQGIDQRVLNGKCSKQALMALKATLKGRQPDQLFRLGAEKDAHANIKALSSQIGCYPGDPKNPVMRIDYVIAPEGVHVAPGVTLKNMRRNGCASKADMDKMRDYLTASLTPHLKTCKLRVVAIEFGCPEAAGSGLVGMRIILAKL